VTGTSLLVVALAAFAGGLTGATINRLLPERRPRRNRPAPARGRLAALAPLRHAVFRWIWIASLASQLGTWIQNVGAVDQMTLVAPNALLLALVQTAMSLPGLLFALPAGALTDIVDRRRLLVAASGWMCGVSALLAAVTFAHLTSAWLLLALTFAIGVGAVAGLPAWQAIIPDLVPRRELAPAVTLSSVAINLARVSGPAVGGLAVAFAGPGAAFGLTALAFATTTVIVVGWRPERPAVTAPVRGVAGAVWYGMRYSLLDAPVRSTLVRAACFIGFASALWALMPAISRQFGLGLAGYSGLLGSLGVGAVASAVLLTRIRRSVAPDTLVQVASLVFAAVSVGVALVPDYRVALLLMPAAGVAWVSALSTFNVSAQLAAPGWVRGRVLAAYQVTQAGALAVGSATWGGMATRLGLVPAMAVAGALLAAGAALTLRWRLRGGEEAVRAAGSGLAGRQLGPYLLEAPIGEGALGEVYLARHVALQAERAVKVMKATVAGHPRIRAAFLDGARTAARLRHPNVVPVYDCGVEGDLPYLVMPYVDSITLEERLARAPSARWLADPTIQRCVRDVAAALDHAHANGVVHGDLKPVNVLVRARDGRAMLGGFAVAPVPEGAPDPAAAGDLAAFAALLARLAGGPPPEPPTPRSATALAEACLAAADRRAPRPAPRWAARAAPAAVAAALLLGGGVFTGVALAGQARPRGAGPPAPERADLGQPVSVAGLRVTVLDAVLDAPVPAGSGAGRGDRLVVVQVRCEGMRTPVAVTPYDWAVTDASGEVFGAVDELDGALPQRRLGPAESVRGAIGFVVPRSAAGLVLHFDAETGDGSVAVPLG
jgi:MFS family permease